MIIEIVSLGSEVLSGSVVNTNAAYLSRSLKEAGFSVARHTVIADESGQLLSCLEEAFKRSDLILTTGGLGPTVDDLTRQTLCEFFETELEFKEEVFQHLTQKFGSRPISLEDQATLPRACVPLLNPIGTASGLILEKEGKILIALPGVPVEMEVIFREEVVPFLQKRFKKNRLPFVEKCHFCLLTESAIDPFLRDLKGQYPLLEIGIYPSFGSLTILLSAFDASIVKAAKKQLLELFPTFVFPSENGQIEEAIHSWMIQNGKTLALAESCTGGAIAARLTNLPGASQYFLGSFVTYSLLLKRTLLGVAESTLQNHGVISGQCAEEMLKGLLKKTGASYGLAVTGLAGPTGATPTLPIGSIYVALGASGEKAEVTHYQLPGNREKIIRLASTFALSTLYRKLVNF